MSTTSENHINIQSVKILDVLPFVKIIFMLKLLFVFLALTMQRSPETSYTVLLCHILLKGIQSHTVLSCPIKKYSVLTSCIFIPFVKKLKDGGWYWNHLSICLCVQVLFRQYLLNCSSFFNQTWYGGASPWHEVPYKKVGLISSRLKSQRGLI